MTGQAWENDELQLAIAKLHTTIQGQQRLAEQSLQETLQRAAAAQRELQSIKAMHAQVLAMQSALTEQGPRNNPQFLLEMVKQLASNVQEQQYNSQQQITQALQLAVSALSDSQAAITESQSLSQMATMVKQCEEMMQKNLWHRDATH